MLPSYRETVTIAFIFLLVLVLAALILPAFATSGDYGVNTGGTAPAPEPTSIPPPTNTPQPTAVPPTATPSGPTATPTCVDGQWGQEPNGAWICIPNSELTPNP